MTQRLPITNPRSAVMDCCWSAELEDTLIDRGCRACDLGFQENINGCCVMRGDHGSKVMIVGEAPGKEEDSRRKPFTGPAGQLMDKIFMSVGLNTNDFYCTNVVLCRPVAPWEATKQNLTPKRDQIDRCKPYLNRQIQLVDPRIIITIGGIATATILNKNTIKINDYRGKLLQENNRLVFPMIHPAAILHASREPAKMLDYKQKTWADIQKLKTILVEEKLI